MSGARLAGDADQFLLPQNWDLNWIKSIREVKLKEYLYGHYIRIKKQIEKVIVLLEQRLIDDPDRSILKTLYDRYVKAEEILTNNDDIKKIMIIGGCRAYLELFVHLLKKRWNCSQSYGKIFPIFFERRSGLKIFRF